MQDSFPDTRTRLAGAFRTRFLVMLGLALYVWLFWVCYVQNVYPLHGFMGLHYEPGPASQTGLIILLSLLPGLVMPLAVTRPSQFFAWGLYTIVYVPTLLYSTWNGQSWTANMEMDLALLTGLMTVLAASFFPCLQLPRFRISQAGFWCAFGVISLVFYAICIWAFGANLRLVSLNEIYLRRAEWEQQIRFPANYAMAWQAQVLNPLLMGYAVCSRKWLWFAVAVAGQLFFFLVGAMKAMPASAVLVLALLPIMARAGRAFAKRWVWSTVLVFGVSALVLGATRNLLTAVLTDLVLWRIFVGPGYLTSLYFDFFKDNPIANFGEVKGFNLFFASPYDEGYKKVLGYSFFSQLTDPNVNLWGDGYANAHLLGVAFESLVALGALWALDCACRSLDIRLVVLATSFQLINLTNGAIIPILLGNGFFLLILVMSLLPRAENKRPSAPPGAPT
ncbi:MAG: hypothetical protein AB1758_08310 [Candidatus Eremiobacterota bacterium]